MAWQVKTTSFMPVYDPTLVHFEINKKHWCKCYAYYYNLDKLQENIRCYSRRNSGIQIKNNFRLVQVSQQNNCSFVWYIFCITKLQSWYSLSKSWTSIIARSTILFPYTTLMSCPDCFLMNLTHNMCSKFFRICWQVKIRQLVCVERIMKSVPSSGLSRVLDLFLTITTLS